MNRYEELRNRQQEEFNALPLGFAFNDKQFHEMVVGWGLDPANDLDKILRLPYGGFIQKKDVDHFQEVYNRHKRELEAAIASDKTGGGFIYEMFLHELYNHEYGYTGDCEETLECLGYDWSDIEQDDRLKYGLEKAMRKIWNES